MAEPRKRRAREPLPGTDEIVTILRATEADVDLARQALIELHGRTSVDDGALNEFLADPQRYFLLAIEGGQIAGGLIGHALRTPDRPEPQFLLSEIETRFERRDHGIGQGLVDRFIADARAAGAYEIRVLANASNAAAMTMYEACGLRRANGDDVMLSLSLSARASK